jgi:hypothetical protein
VARLTTLLVAVALAAPIPGRGEEPAAPARPAPAPAAAPAPTSAVEVMVGEVITLPYNRSAAYGPGRVRGPAVNLTDGGNGEWKGNIRDLDGVFTVTEKRISGGNLNMVMERDGDGWTCQGTVDGKRVRIVLSPDGLVARYDSRLYDLKRVARDLWASIPSGPGIRVKGDAAGRDPYYPQFIFALLAVL